ncbi:MAG: transglycosylase SLT domain-containing protein [Bdellovibrionales bacterium]
MIRSGLIFFVSQALWAAPQISTVSVSLDQNFAAPRWMYGEKKPKADKLTNLLIEAKQAFLDNNASQCMTSLNKAYAMGKSLAPWLAWNQLQCAQLLGKGGKPSVSFLKSATQRVYGEPSWLLSGPSSSFLRDQYVSAMLLLVEHQLKTDRAGAWKTIDRLQQVRGWMTIDERASTLKWAGELAFVEQNLSAAVDFLARSLNEKESSEVRSRMESIRSTLLGKQKVAPAAPTSQVKKEDLGISDEEKDIAARMRRSFDSRDLVSAVEDGIKLIEKFPGSRHAQEATELILDIYLSIANKSDEKYVHVRSSVVKEMQKVDAARLYRWANNAYARSNYLDALTLAEKSFAKFSGQVDGTKALLLAGKAAVAAGEYGDAAENFEQLMKYHGGTPEAAEAIFRLGLLEFRRKRYPQATAYFERLLALASGTDFEYRGLYWQWRTQQKIDAAKSSSVGQALISRYPFSYYGLRAQAELNGGEIKLAPGATPIKAELRLLPGERLGWERMIALLKAGWFKEAERELDSLPEPQSHEERLIRAKLWALTMRYDLAIQEVSRAVDEDPTLAQLSVLRVVFPEEYAKTAEKEAKQSSLTSDWIFSVIRQESSFRADAKSPAGALGLMQLLPSTGKEIARDLRLKAFRGTDSLLDPDINIKLGATYLSRLIKKFNGHIPLALAAYNAGPTRLKRWLSARKDLSLLEGPPSSSPDVEIWLDEIPWEETSFYVKAILRNWMIYRLLDGSKVSLSEPLWVDAKSTTR